jgi:GlpG protein
MKSRFDSQSQFYLPPITVLLFLVWFVLCITGIFGPIANWAHGTGLVTGAAIGYAPVAWRNLTKQ